MSADKGVRIQDAYADEVSDLGRSSMLSTASAIINNHQGLLTVESTTNRGIAVNIFLPAAESSQASPNKMAPQLGSEKDSDTMIGDIAGDVATQRYDFGHHSMSLLRCFCHCPLGLSP